MAMKNEDEEGKHYLSMLSMKKRNLMKSSQKITINQYWRNTMCINENNNQCEINGVSICVYSSIFNIDIYSYQYLMASAAKY